MCSKKPSGRIIHLSDLHVGYRSCGDKAEQIVGNIIAREDPAQSVIIITGDIVEHGSRAKDVAQGLGLIRRLRESGFIVLLCPGNHDYGTGLTNSPATATKFLRTFLPEVKQFPHLDIIKGTAFIALDSNEDELHWYDRFMADGELGAGQLIRLAKLLDDPSIKDIKKVVYLHHHPFHSLPFHQLKDRKAFKRVVEGKVDILLYGHLHFGRSYDGSWGIPVVLDGGSSTGKRAARVLGINIKHRVIDLADLSYMEKNYLA